MSRSTNRVNSRRKRKLVLKKSSGSVGRRNRCYKLALRSVEKGMQYSYRDRKNLKRSIKSLWIIRINSFARENGYKYSTFIKLIRSLIPSLNTKSIADLCFTHKEFLKSVISSQ